MKILSLYHYVREENRVRTLLKDVNMDALELCEIESGIRVSYIGGKRKEPNVIAIVRIEVETLEKPLEMAVITFAGITKNEEDILVHLYHMEDVEVVTKAYYINKYTGQMREGELCSATNMDMRTYFSRGGYIGFQDFKSLLETNEDDYEQEYRILQNKRKRRKKV